MNKNYLHIHSTYSVGDSAQSPEDIVLQVKKLGGENVTLTDHRTLLGVDAFMDAGRKYGINTIPGVENEINLPEKYAIILSNGDDERKEALSHVRNHIVMIPYDYTGFQSISYATRDANTNIVRINKTDYPCLTDAMLEKHFTGNKHVFATSACIQGPIGYILLISFRLKKRIERHMASVEEFKQSYDDYEAAEAKENEFKAKIKEISKTITAESKPFKKPHQEKIRKLKKKLDASEKDSKAYQEAIGKLQLAENLVEIASSKVDTLTKEKESLTEAKNRLAAQKAELKKEHNKYEKAIKELSSLQRLIVPEDTLYRAAKQRLLELKNIFSCFYIELQYHGLDEEAYVMPLLLRLADETGTPIIAANDAHILDQSEASVEARRLIRFNYFKKSETITDADRELYIKNDAELIEALSKVIPYERAEEAVHNLDILNSCHVDFPKGTHYPKLKGGKTFDDVLEGARNERIASGEWGTIEEKRFEHEKSVIKSMGYVDYHMIVEQFCRIGRLMGRVPENRRSEIYDHFEDLEEWVNNQDFDIGVGVGPGRGSAAGSLICYMLGITNIDPIKYNLLFERFLNPERVSMPDIDTDIATGIRPILIAYLRWYYGENAVCSIVTVTTYGAKAAVQLAGRDRADQLYGADKAKKSQYLHNVSYALSDMIPETPGTTLNDCEKNILPKISTNSEMTLLWTRAKLIENCVSGTGVHAGGVIISDNDNVNEYVPLAWNSEKRVWVAQCDMVKAEEKGMLKMDLLGLNTLDIDNVCIHAIKQYHGISVNLDEIPFEKEVFQHIYTSGYTNGVFQVESDGMKQMLRDFKPSSFEDIILLIAAYRPGPMQYLPDVIAVKNGKKKATYKHPLLEPILKTTYGATIYQEQVMQIFQSLAGYSLGGADLVRRAMSKKKTEKLAQERKAFIYGDEERGIAGCLKQGISMQTANEIFDEMMEFAKYAFNKSHAAAYALVSYQTAWLKYHYPAEFFCALFICKPQDKYGPIYSDCARCGIQILPPDINSSYYKFVIEKGSIRYGFKGIKGIGDANKEFLQLICNERNHGFFKSFHDFVKRTCNPDQNGNRNIPKELITNLINAGSFDSLGYNREALVNALEEMVKIKASVVNEYDKALDAIIIKVLDRDQAYNFEKESELLGKICSVDPLAEYNTDEYYGCVSMDQLNDGAVTVFGLVTEAKKLISKKGAEMLRLKLQGKAGECTLIFMGTSYIKYANDFENYINTVVKATGRAKDNTIFCNKIVELHPHTETYYIDLKDYGQQMYMEKQDVLHKKRWGSSEVEVYLQLHYYKSGNCIDSPIVIKRYCSPEYIVQFREKGIRIQKG